MGTITKIELAVEIAERSMANDGYGHGPCLSVRLVGDSSKDKWEVEFAYEGLADRRPDHRPQFYCVTCGFDDRGGNDHQLDVAMPQKCQQIIS